jgi:hypothetical protein
MWILGKIINVNIALLQKKVDRPPEAKNVPIGERQRGRPKKIVKHL